MSLCPARKWLLLLMILLPLPVSAPAQQPETVIIGLVGLSTNSIHPFISKDAGLFLKYGVDSRLVVF
jgi:ABC-type nitrate/sulfonate/bicarbonate transport system substrate-binding protein